MENWIPLADVLLDVLAYAVPSPMGPPSEPSTPSPPICFYVAAIQPGADGAQYAVGRVCYDVAKLEACEGIMDQLG